MSSSSNSSDDRVRAAANKILQTLDPDNANDMFRILSGLDPRFLQFSDSSNDLRGGASGEDNRNRSISRQGYGGSSKYSSRSSGGGGGGIADPELVSAKDLILKWDSIGAETQRPSFIWTDNPEEADDYLQAVDIIQEFIEQEGSAGGKAVVEAREVLQAAMARLEEEFRNLLDSYGEPMDPAFIYEVVNKSKGEGGAMASEAEGNSNSKHGRNGDEDDEAEEDEEEEEEERVPKARPEQKSFRTVTLDLLPTMTVLNLSELAARMVRSGYTVECKQAFVASRRPLMEESLQRLGLVHPTIDDVQRMSWEILESECSKWVSIMKVGIGVLLHSEKDFCDKVFGGGVVGVGGEAELSEGAFAEVAGPSMKQLLNFAESVAISRRTPEKIFRLLDMYEALDEILPSIKALFAGERSVSRGGSGGGGIHAEAVAILGHLADAVRGTCVEFENAIRRDVPRAPYPGGAIHPLTRYVMNCIKFFGMYTQTLDHLLRSAARHQDKNSPARRQEGDGIGPLAALILSILDLLDENLDSKSKLYRDTALASIFLMNNLRYMVQKVREDPEVRKLIPDDWIRRHNGKLHQLHNEYRRSAWTKVVSCFREDGINQSGSGSSVNAATRNILRERFKLFNAAFEEAVRIHSGWVVKDSQLCTELQISVTGMVLPAYRNFLARFQHHLDPRNPEKYVKYSADDVECQLSELFVGSAAGDGGSGGAASSRR